MHRIGKKGHLFLFFALFPAIIIAHGFAVHTLVDLSDGSKRDISNICIKSLRNKISVTTYDITNHVMSNQLVKAGKTSISNCYIRLGFDDPYQNEDDIVCAPIQTFYVPERNAWIPAFLLKIGDCLLTKDLTSKPITYKQLVAEPIDICMLEVERTHTFFVGKHALLAHNFLPLAVNFGLSIPFGSAAIGAGFLGPIGITASVVVGGIMAVATKIFRRNKISRTESNWCARNDSYEHDNIPEGCFTVQASIDTKYVYPIENQSVTHIGCINLEAQNHKSVEQRCFENSEAKKVGDHGCFEQIQPTKQLPFNSQEKVSVVKKDIYGEKEQYNGPWYNRTEDWIDEHPVGQRLKKSLERSRYTNQGKRVFKVTENIKDCDGFKKGDYIVVDAMHKDHLEVFDRYAEWKSVANFDGSKNEKKTEQGKQEPRQKLKKQR